MQAMAITHTGEVALTESPEPGAPGSSQTLIKVTAVGLNRLDLLMLHGDLAVELPHIPGSDVVGTVVDCPSGQFAAGTRVLVNPGLPQDADAPWPANRECPYVRILGCHTPGGLAELVLVSDAQVYLVPEHLTDSEAATLPLDYLTAWRMLVTKAQVRPDEYVAVWGASGSLGCAALAILKHLGARPIALISRPDDEKTLMSLGATECVDYTRPDFKERVAELTDGGPSVVFESVGAATWTPSQEMVRQGGRIVICGTTSGGVAPTDLEELYYKQVTILGSRMGYPAEFEAMLSAVTARTLEAAPIALTTSHTEAMAAFAYLDNRRVPGKVVVTFGHE